MTVWTDERVAKLKQLHAENYSFSAIGEALGGVSRNACIGKAKRLGLPERRKSWRPSKKTLPWRRVRVSPIVGLLPDEQFEAAPLPTEFPAEAIPLAQRKTFAQLQWHHCRFIYGSPASGDFFYCGGTKYAGSYCAYHHAITHRGSAQLSEFERERRRQFHINAHRIATEAERMTG